MEFRELGLGERSRVNSFYKLTSYKRPVSGDDRVFVAEDGDEIHGAVRVESKSGVQVLRGMYMHPESVRKGIGTKLLSHIEPILAETDSYCIPFDHLFGFYGQAGFSQVAPENAPSFLAERIQKYFGEGKRVAIMHRQRGYE